MTSKYGSESYSVEFRDLQATTMSVDRTGHYALLAGRKYLSVIKLETEPPGQVLVRIPYGGKYEISNTQWSRRGNGNLLGVASSQRCDIFELTDGSELKCLYKLKGHTRVITDLDWSTVCPSLLATSSFDSYVHIWDVRSPRDPGCEKPQASLSALDGASQVKWNKWQTDTLASCDGGHVKIWDIRKPNSPLEFIAAHASKINGLEWVAKDVVVTAAQDCTVRLSRLAASNPKNTKGPCLTLSAPIWRARPTPFGRGIITQCVPILRRDSGLLSLWNWQNPGSPVFTFQAHDIVEFAWKRSPNNSDLLTWSRDQTLRVWALPREVIELCGEESWPAVSSQNLARTSVEQAASLEEDFVGSQLGTRRGSRVSPKKEGSLERRFRKAGPELTPREEFLGEDLESVSERMSEQVSFEEVDLERGLLRFGWRTDPKNRLPSVLVQAAFPINYPVAAPHFLLTRSGAELDKALLLKTLRQTAQSCARKQESSLGPCIAHFTAFMTQSEAGTQLEEAPPPSPFPSRGVSNVPFPRTSGARFCSVGVLVCFGRPSYLKRVKSNCDAGTPRSLSALGPFLSQVADESSAVVTQGGHKSRRTRRVEKKRAGLVTLFDVTPLLPLTKDLASAYKHVSSQKARKGICAENAGTARNCKKLSVAHTWQASSMIADFTCSYNHSGQRQEEQEKPEQELLINDTTCQDEEDLHFILYHPLGSDLVHNMITHYAGYGDFQTAATVACHYTVPSPGQDFCQHGFQHLEPADPQEPPPSLSRSGHAGIQTPWSFLSPALRAPRLVVPKWWTKGEGWGYHTVTGGDSVHGITIPAPTPFFRQHRSNSWSESLDEGKVLGALYEPTSAGSNGHGFLGGRETWNGGGKPGYLRGAILDPAMGRIYDGYKKAYAEILYRWGLLQQRAEVLKCLTSGVESSFLLRSGVDYVIQCPTCSQSVKGSHCSTCKRIISICSICNMPAKGLCTFCAACGHGGHAAHMLEWFKPKRKTCPTGCGCQCLTENARVFK